MYNRSLTSTDEWETPQWLFDKLSNIFHFDLDVCATAKNTKCVHFFNEEDNSLLQSWHARKCWMNPPYSRILEKFVEKAHDTMCNGGNVVALLPARTGTKWWYNYCRDVEVWFLKGRLKFENMGSTPVNCAPFPSALVFFNSKNNKCGQFSNRDPKTL
jgi:phage N-6-adenine-methyltransferase